MRTRRHGLLAICRHEATQHVVQPELDTWLPHLVLRTQVQGRPQARTLILHSKNHGPTQSRTRPTQNQENLVTALN